jgi:hypothetical protein
VAVEGDAIDNGGDDALGVEVVVTHAQILAPMLSGEMRPPAASVHSARGHRFAVP